MDHVGFTYPDLDTHVGRLRGEGVTILEEIHPFGDTRAATVEDLRSRGLIEGQALSGKGRELRQSIEDETDRMNAPAYDVLSEQEKRRYVELALPLSKAVVEAGLVPERR